MSVPGRIALRYLFTRKSNNVIGWISAVSTAGMAIGAAALILVLSVYNGFDGIIRSNLSQSDPECLIVPAEGKYFSTEILPEHITDYVEVAQDRVFVEYDGMQSAALLVGKSNIAQCSIAADLARDLGVRVHRLQDLNIYYPKRGAKSVSMANPMASLQRLRIHPRTVFSPSTEFESARIYVPLDSARALLGLSPTEVSAVELSTSKADALGGNAGTAPAADRALPDGLKALDRLQQHPELYKMMRYEKAAIYLILLFVVVLVAFNILACLNMLQIEKTQDRFTMKALGMTDSQLRKVFLLEGWFISLLGLAIGLTLGVILALVQQKFGIIQIPGNAIVSAYPVVLEFTDILLTAAGVALIGFITSAISTKKI